MFLSGCSTISSLHNDDKGLTFSPTWERVTTAAENALYDPGTWIPAAATVAVAVSGKDKEWALDTFNTRPLFKNQDAHQISEQTRELLYLGMVATALPAQPITTENRYLEGLTMATAQFATISATTLATGVLKKNISRKIPNYDPLQPDDESFPSNHATEPFAAVAVIRRNSDRLNVSDGWKTVIKSTAYVTASVSAWARIEMGLHYPTDQLLSAAIGNFIGLFVHDAFLLSPDINLKFSLYKEKVTSELNLRF